MLCMFILYVYAIYIEFSLLLWPICYLMIVFSESNGIYLSGKYKHLTLIQNLRNNTSFLIQDEKQMIFFTFSTLLSTSTLVLIDM